MTKVTGGRPYLPRRGCRTQPRVAYSRTLGNDKPQRPSTPKGLQSTAQGRVLAHPGERQAAGRIYPEGVAEHSPGSRTRAPWGTTSPNVHLPRRGCRTQPKVTYSRTLGNDKPQRPSTPKGVQNTTQRRALAHPGERQAPTSIYTEGVAEHRPGSRARAPWGTTSPNVHLPRRGCRTQPRVAYSRALGNDKAQRPFSPKGVAEHSPGSRTRA